MWESFRYFSKVLPYVKRYKALAGVILIFTVLAAGVALFQPWPLAFLIDNVLGNKGVPSFLGFLDGADVWVKILFGVSAGLAIALVASGVSVANDYLQTKLDQRMVLEFRSDLFQHSQRLSMAFHDHQRAGRFIFLVNNSASAAGSVVLAVPPLAESVLTLFGMFFVVYRLQPDLALLAASVVPFIYCSISYYGDHVHPRLMAVNGMEAESLTIVHEAMSMLRVIVSFGREGHEYRRFRSQGEEAVDARVKLTVRQSLFSLVVNLLTAIGTALVLGFGAYSVIRRDLTVGELLVVMAYIAAVYQPLEAISSTLAGLQDQFIQVRLASQLLERVPEVVERPGARALDRAEGKVSFRNVSFDYEGRTGTLKDISFEAAAGDVIAIVGPTGAGKTTLMSLVPRFADPGRGQILIDDEEIRDLTLESLRRQVSLVLQEPLLFSGTVLDNIKYGDLDATKDDVERAAKEANAHDFIMRLPKGYRTELGERGSRISGGERQRLCIARAFLRDAPILILDEPTSSIDSKTESVILDALDRLMVGRTTFMIAHRLSTIRSATRILVMNDGELVEHGTHDELYERQGLYRLLHEMQVGGRQLIPTPQPAALEEGPSPMGALGPGAAPPAKLAIPAPHAEPAVPAPVSAPRPEPLAPITVASPPPSMPRSEPLAPVNVAGRRSIVVLGMMTKIPVAGVVWQTIHYLVGLQRLGFDVYYVEAHARTPSMFMEHEHDDGSARASAFIASVMRRFGFDSRWAFHALHENDRCYGMSRTELSHLYRRADLIINLHGGTVPLPEHSETGRLIYVETDPVQLQIELHDGDQEAIDFLEPHHAFFTFGENYGRPGCQLPVSDRFTFHPTRQPVVLDFWNDHKGGNDQVAGPLFTTIGNWRQPWREVTLAGKVYQWSKHHEFLRFLTLPNRTDQPFELALASLDDDGRRTLENGGWRTRNSLDFSLDLDTYRDYIGGSRGEFTVAKDQNVRLRTGWFSDRSATYLASGRPVITQETGFSDILPTGNGLFAFETMEDILAALDEVNGNYVRHQAAARQVAREFFSHDEVLGPLLTSVGLAPIRRRRRQPQRPTPVGPFPSDLALGVVGRHPTTLRPATVTAVLSGPLPEPGPVARDGSGQERNPPRASIVVVTHDNLVFTRMCLESLLADASLTDVEIIVVDNGSTDLSPIYLRTIEASFPNVHLVANDDNRGFAPAVNQGLARAKGERLVLLNNDTLLTPGWLDRLLAHLDDPSVGMVGPVTNAAPNEVRINVPYGTYGGLVRFARDAAGANAGRSFEVDMLTMFCVALSADIYQLIGPLDEQFEVGTFEDDDYAVRLRTAGYRLVCAEDAFVHHFGEASLGKLAATGELSRVFEANRRRFDQKWGVAWESHHGRPDPAYDELTTRVRQQILGVIPERANVLVVSKGDDELLRLNGCRAGHFPQAADGAFAGHYPADSAEAIAHLEQLRSDGAEFLVFPNTSLWWLDYYQGFRQHLEQGYDDVGSSDDACRIFAARGAR